MRNNYMSKGQSDKSFKCDDLRCLVIVTIANPQPVAIQSAMINMFL